MPLLLPTTTRHPAGDRISGLTPQWAKFGYRPCGAARSTLYPPALRVTGRPRCAPNLPDGAGGRAGPNMIRDWESCL